MPALPCCGTPRHLDSTLHTDGGGGWCDRKAAAAAFSAREYTGCRAAAATGAAAAAVPRLLLAVSVTLPWEIEKRMLKVKQIDENKKVRIRRKLDVQLTLFLKQIDASEKLHIRHKLASLPILKIVSQDKNVVVKLFVLQKMTCGSGSD
ncbi:unnamed protein product [Lampetra planeri]